MLQHEQDERKAYLDGDFGAVGVAAAVRMAVDLTV